MSREATEDEVCRSGLIHRVYAPDSVGNSSQPAVILVHGRAGNSRVMWTFSKVLGNCRPVVVSPQAFVEDPLGGHSWWSVDGNRNRASTAKVTVEPFLSAIEKMEHFISVLPALYNVDRRRIYAVGFSQGAGLLAAMSLKNPSLFKAVALLAGFVPRAAVGDRSFISPKLLSGEIRAPKFFISHGSKDNILSLEKAHFGKVSLEQLGAEVELYVEEVGHKVGSGGMKALGVWLNKEISESLGRAKQ